MQTVITGFHRDEAAQWVAQLACGHTQHVRHQPPWQNHAWVLSDSERLQRVGAAIDCPLCDMPVLPDELQEYKHTTTFAVPQCMGPRHFCAARRGSAEKPLGVVLVDVQLLLMETLVGPSSFVHARRNVRSSTTTHVERLEARWRARDAHLRECR